MRPATVLIIAMLGLCGCWKDQQRQLDACEIIAQNAYPTNDITLGSATEGSIKQCMRAHGYAFTMSSSQCLVVPDMSANPHCYVPTGRLARSVFGITGGG